MAVPTNTAKGAGAKAPAPVASGQTPSPAAGAPASPSALETATRHGGLPGGKPREDGLKPGSPEALAADRKKDADRKRAARAVANRLRPEPPALPSAVPGATQTPGNSPAAAPGSPVDPAFVPWQADIIKPLVEDLLEAAEESRVAQFAAKCKQLGDMPKLIKEIEGDAHFPKAAKVLLVTSLPRLAAKWLNKSGISAEYQDELAVATAFLLIIKQDRATNAKLDKLIALTKGPKGPEKKEGQTIFETPTAAAKTEAPKEASPAAALAAPQQIATVRQ